jgi:L-alanine-DL-glutamate epimerase-like enolase superfamily enzyme
VLALQRGGIRAVKLRLHSQDWRVDLPVIEAVRDTAGRDLEIMVDANQGWRMPGDVTPRWDLTTASAFAHELERLDVYWLEEPLATSDLEGYDALSRNGMRIAAGEMVRTAAEALDLVRRGGVDVVQTDVVLAGGIEGCRRIAAVAEEAGRWWSPHTWSNGYGLLANIHAALAFSSCPYLEVPFDPPAWSAERRDWLLPVPIEISADGTISAPPGPGLGVVPDFDALEPYRIS